MQWVPQVSTVVADVLRSVWRQGALAQTGSTSIIIPLMAWNINYINNKANLRDLIAATGLVILLKFDPNHRFFSPYDLEIWCMTSSILHQALCIISNPSVNSNWSYTPETLNSGQNRRFFVPCDLEIWSMTLENNMAPLLYYLKICASFQIHLWIETEFTVRKRSIRVKIGDFLSCVILKFDGWPWKTIGHFFYTTPSFVQHFKSIGEFKLELQSGNTQFGSKSEIFCPVWPCNLTDDLEKR